MSKKNTPLEFKISDDPGEAFRQLTDLRTKIPAMLDVTLERAVAAGYGPSTFAKEVGEPVSNIRRALRTRGLLAVKPRTAKVEKPKAAKATKATAKTKASDKAKTAAAKRSGRVVTTTTHVANRKAEPKAKAQVNTSSKAGRRSLAKKAS